MKTAALIIAHKKATAVIPKSEVWCGIAMLKVAETAQRFDVVAVGHTNCSTRYGL